MKSIQPYPASIPPMPWLGESTLPQRPVIKEIKPTKLTLNPFMDEAVRFWSVFQLVDWKEWRLVKKMPKTKLEWEIPTSTRLSGAFRVQSVDGANQMSEAVYFNL